MRRCWGNEFENKATLIVDEVGYTPLDPIAANLLFHVVSARYERGSMVINQ
ncbi:ATP-binding protein [Anoxybacillus sp. P3H1B]|uniref:ATP-binding protein n=1 Tax=Anoxybacillus sp. P3H1B TaxID=1769293 RepID=UPI003517A0BC